MKPAFIILAFLLSGCTYVSVKRPDGSGVTFISTKDVRVRELRVSPADGLVIGGVSDKTSDVVEAGTEGAVRAFFP